MMILWLIGSGVMVLLSIRLCMLPRRKTSSMESFEENILLRDKYLKQMRRDRIEWCAANQLREWPSLESHLE
jgi:hypothetical protein